MDQQNSSASENAQVNTHEPMYGPAADRMRDRLREGNVQELRDLRRLLEAVRDALTLPYTTPGYARRIRNRAEYARIIIEGALDGNPGDIGYNADYLRHRMDAEQARETGPGEGQ